MSSPENTTKNYDEYWSDLTVSHASHPGNKFRYDLIASRLKARGAAPGMVMDAGCGDGSLLAVISAALDCGDLYGMDVSANVPVNRPGSGIHFQQQDLGAPIPENLAGRFDLVLCSEVIEHVPDDSLVVDNLARLAKPGGWVVLTTQTGNIYKTEQYLGHVRHYDINDLRNRLERAGLAVQEAFLCGWPWLNLQKLAAHHFQGAVQKNIVQARELSLPVRAVFALLTGLYKLSSRSAGPQIVLLARKP